MIGECLLRHRDRSVQPAARTLTRLLIADCSYSRPSLDHLVSPPCASASLASLLPSVDILVVLLDLPS
ncbi:hypothetical protein C6341_g1540 [Phytophthora cactorum]|nr:hypothetical protein C6341_g1540 [Phytophthora cactorum]